MVRAGVVDHPAQWRHSSAHALASSRQRYRMVDQPRLLERLELSDWARYQQWYESSLAEVLARDVSRTRQSFQSSSTAVGGTEWLELAARKCGMKRYDLVGSAVTWPGGATSSFVRKKTAS